MSNISGLEGAGGPKNVPETPLHSQKQEPNLPQVLSLFSNLIGALTSLASEAKQIRNHD